MTAEFRSASVQDTPIAITAVNAEMLEARSQTNLFQITANAPNVSLRPANSSFGSALVAYIRGIGQTDFNPSVEPGIGVYVDDVYYSTITGNLLDLLDLDRVEVLRGPQGTLSGRNAIGGALKLFTRKPDGKDDINLSLTKGEFNRTDVKGAGGFTISDNLHVRVAGMARSMDGYVTRLDYACENHLPPPGQPGGLPTYVQAASCKLGTEGGQSYALGPVLAALGRNRQILARRDGEHHERQFGVAAERARGRRFALRARPAVAYAERTRSVSAVCFNSPEQPDVYRSRGSPGTTTRADLLRQQPQRRLRRRGSTFRSTAASSPAAST